MSVKLGVAPIAWSNDDMPELGGDTSLEQCLKEANEAGYIGIESGGKFPKKSSELIPKLDQFNLKLCSGWYGANLRKNSVEEEKKSIQEQLDLFKDCDAPCIVFAEVSGSIQGDPNRKLSTRPQMERDEWQKFCEKISELGKYLEDEGMPLAYHHHMGSIIETEDDVNWLMDASSRDLNLCFDTGHLLFGGGDVMATLDRWGDRIHHVHYKDIRPSIVEDVRKNNKSFLDAVIAGAFTVPGDGCIDFQAVSNSLAAMSYSGWIVVEAEQDPAKAPPYDYSKMGYDHILKVCKKADLSIN